MNSSGMWCLGYSPSAPGPWPLTRGCCCKLLQGARALLYMPLAVIIGSRCTPHAYAAWEGGPSLVSFDVRRLCWAGVGIDLRCGEAWGHMHLSTGHGCATLPVQQFGTPACGFGARLGCPLDQAKAAARLDLDVSAWWASQPSYGLCGVATLCCSPAQGEGWR
jgi:hypothetical protein